MKLITRRARLPLAVGQTATLRRAQGTRVTVLAGSAWITIDDDPRDIVLAPGESFVIEDERRVLVHALRDRQPLDLLLDAGAPAPRRPLRDALAARWRRAFQHGSGAMSSA